MYYLTNVLTWGTLVSDSDQNEELIKRFENINFKTKAKQDLKKYIIRSCKMESDGNKILKTKAFEILEENLKDFIE